MRWTYFVSYPKSKKGIIKAGSFHTTSRHAESVDQNLGLSSPTEKLRPSAGDGNPTEGQRGRTFTAKSLSNPQRLSTKRLTVALTDHG